MKRRLFPELDQGTLAQLDRLSRSFTSLSDELQKARPHSIAIEAIERQNRLSAMLADSLPLRHIEENLRLLRSMPLAEEIEGLTVIGSDIARHMEQHRGFLRDALLEPKLEALAEISFPRIDSIAALTLELPRMAAADWSAATLRERLPLVKDSVLNVAALQQLETATELHALDRLGAIERVQCAADFVWNHGEFIRRLPPVLHSEQQPPDDHSEEIGPKLEGKLQAIDPRFAELRRESWQNLANGEAGARLAAHGMREILGDLLRMFAPDDDVVKTELWLQRKDRKLTRPTRRMRFEYIVGSRAKELAALIQFDESIERANKFAHTFAHEVEVVRAYLAQLETCIYLTIFYATTQRKGSR